MKKASWIVLFVLGLVVLAISFLSAGLAYSGGSDWPIGPSSLVKVEAAVPGVMPALRGVRGTSAAFGAAYAVLWLSIVLGPYKRGETWAWWALLGASLVLSAVILLRVPLVGTTSGMPVGITPLVIALVGLLLDLGRLREAK